MSRRDDRTVDQQLRELAIANDLIRSLTETRELPNVLRSVLDRVKMITQAEGLSLLMYDPESDELVFSVAETLLENTLVGQRRGCAAGAAGWAARHGRDRLVEKCGDTSDDAASIPASEGFVPRGLLAIPLIGANRVLGVLELVNRFDGLPFTDEDTQALQKFTSSWASAGTLLGQFNERDLAELLGAVVATIPAEGVVLMELDPTRSELVVVASRVIQAGVVAGIRLRSDQGIAGWVAQNRQALRLDQVTNDPRYYAGIQSQTHLRPRSMLCVPILNRRSLLGVIQLINKVDGTPFTTEDERAAQLLADHAALAIENASLYRQAHLASITDDLTGLFNTRHFNRELPKIVDGSQTVSLLVLDLDNFKAVVDTHGHLVGSRTIRQLGQKFGTMLRPNDVAARFGGDEFVVILPDTDCRTAVSIAESLRLAVESTRTLLGTDIDLTTVTASVGVATFPDHARDGEALFKAADAAMYRAKRMSKNAVTVAKPDPPL